MKSLFDTHFFIGFALGGTFFCLLTIIMDFIRLARLYAAGVLVLP